MEVSKTTKKEIAKAFMQSITEDNDKWLKHNNGIEGGYAWIVYKSPEYYNKLVYLYNTVTGSCDIYRGNSMKYSFTPNLRQRIIIKKQLKRIDDKYRRIYEQELKELCRTTK